MLFVILLIENMLVCTREANLVLQNFFLRMCYLRNSVQIERWVEWI